MEGFGILGIGEEGVIYEMCFVGKRRHRRSRCSSWGEEPGATLADLWAHIFSFYLVSFISAKYIVILASIFLHAILGKIIIRYQFFQKKG